MEKIKEEKPFYLENKITIKPYDIDVVGHVNNIVYVRWLEDIRMEMLDSILPFGELIKEGISPILLKTEIEYKHPVKIYDHLRYKAYIKELQNVKLIIDVEFFVEEKIVCKASQTGLFINIDKNRPIRIPQKLVDLYTKQINN